MRFKGLIYSLAFISALLANSIFQYSGQERKEPLSPYNITKKGRLEEKAIHGGIDSNYRAPVDEIPYKNEDEKGDFRREAILAKNDDEFFSSRASLGKIDNPAKKYKLRDHNYADYLSRGRAHKRRV